MLISILVTGYVIYLYLKLKNETKIDTDRHVASVDELNSAILRLDVRVADIVGKMTAAGK